MKSFLDLVKTRQSVRKYADKPVLKEDLFACLEAARLAPSATNSQPWKFIIVDDEKVKLALAKTTYNKVFRFNKFVGKAPLIVVITLEAEQMSTRLGRALKNKEWRLIDIGITAEHFCLQAEEQGLATCMIGWFSEKEAKAVLKVPNNRSIALMITVGYPMEDQQIRKKVRKDLDDMISYNSY